MPESMIARKKLLGATVEVTKGTLIYPTAPLPKTLVYDAKMVPVDLYSDGQRKPQGHHLGSVPSVKGPEMARLTFRTEWIFQDAFKTLITGAGFLLTALVADPSSDLSDHDTFSFKLWEDGRVKRMFGAVCSALSIENGGPGQRIFITWEWIGVWDGVIDEALPAYADGNPVVDDIGFRAASMVFTLGGSPLPNFPTFTLDLGLEAEMREDLTTAPALFHGIVGDMGGTLVIPHEARIVADLDSYGLLRSGTTAALVLTLSDGSNTMSITGPTLQREEVDDQESGKRLVDAFTFRMHNSGGAAAGQDWIKFTESA